MQVRPEPSWEEPPMGLLAPSLAWKCKTREASIESITDLKSFILQALEDLKDTRLGGSNSKLAKNSKLQIVLNCLFQFYQFSCNKHFHAGLSFESKAGRILCAWAPMLLHFGRLPEVTCTLQHEVHILANAYCKCVSALLPYYYICEQVCRSPE